MVFKVIFFFYMREENITKEKEKLHFNKEHSHSIR